MSKFKVASLLATVALLMSGTACFADSVAVTPAVGWTVGTDTSSFTIGWQFTVNSPVDVTGLGYYAGLGTLNDNHSIGIFNSKGNLIDSAIVPAGGGTLNKGFLFVNAPVELSAGAYTIGGASIGSSDPVITTTTSTIAIPEITLGESVYSYGTSLTLPTTAAPGFTFLGPDFETAAPVPEPSTWLLLGTGLLAMAIFGKKIFAEEKA